MEINWISTYHDAISLMDLPHALQVVEDIIEVSHMGHHFDHGSSHTWNVTLKGIF